MNPHEILRDATAEHQPVASFAMFSGGHDSLCSVHLAMNSGMADAVVHINTGIGVEETREFVRETCNEHHWPLIEMHPAGKMNYRDIVRKFGFPGPGFHMVPYRWLKERSVDKLVRDSKYETHDRVMLITGVRSSESSRRMGHVQPVVRKGAKVWVAPIIEWDTKDKEAYISEQSLRRNQVADILCMSGECLCGAFARPGELAWIRKWYPRAAAQIDELAVEAKDLGVWDTWGVPHTPRVPKEQMELPLCYSCEVKLEEFWNATEEESVQAGIDGNTQGVAVIEQG
jgi:3'-phosphoadenosine 5'-phosphosulfate sulfotransferase (PAPS reductase)/FAD synthetase